VTSGSLHWLVAHELVMGQLGAEVWRDVLRVHPIPACAWLWAAIKHHSDAFM